MQSRALYQPNYAESWALVIGINKYRHTNPLAFACNDAQAVTRTLVERFGFPKTNVKLLLDTKATRKSILQTFLGYAKNVGIDDRILVFFAGHGHTESGRRGETGFLVPVDGKMDDLASLIRWDELTRNADLVPAKHVLFLMDACYGGLALTRTSIQPGGMRFLKDMLQRYSRQVLTAGKADEVVSDGGGKRAGHSIFTSHLLDGMEGAAAPGGGTITGYGLMAYVYDRVGSDPQSRQTPHFGFFDGDGDFIFDTSVLAELALESSQEPEAGKDLLIKLPAYAASSVPREETVAVTLKGLIATSSEKIRLDDYISGLIRHAAEGLSPDKFSTGDPLTNEEFASRLQRYETAIADLEIAAILLARWAEPGQISLLERIFSRLAEVDKPQAGLVAWVRLAWYPMLLLMYAAGISALAARRYDALRAALLTPVYSEQSRNSQKLLPVTQTVIDNVTEASDLFKRLPEMERKYVPRSEYIFTRLQPVIEDQLFVGRSYEALFDEFEILLALTYADFRAGDSLAHVWGPPGRFGWKERGRFGEDKVYSEFVKRAVSQGDRWEPLREGFFNNSAKRFADLTEAYSQLLARISWW
jgi:uncharacterized caspase-like protein